MKLAAGTTLLFDYAACRDPDDPDEKRVDLAEELRSELEEMDTSTIDFVAITHLDEDHYKGASDFFYFEHAEKYQDDDRIGIGELWVPAAVITEKGRTGEARVIQEEARHRLREGERIRVFSRPARLEEWLDENDLTLEDRADLITDAGQLVPGLSLVSHALEVFVHSPFAVRQDDNSLEDRNTDAIAVQLSFEASGHITQVLMFADLGHEALADVVKVTRNHDRGERLGWDAFKLPHHCSYTALSPDKGTDRTEPVEEVAWLVEEQAREGCIVVSTSLPVPTEDTDLPPHRQAAAYYRAAIDPKDGELVVTMEFPDEEEPKPLVIIIDEHGAGTKRVIEGAATAVVTSTAPRAGVS